MKKLYLVVAVGLVAVFALAGCKTTKTTTVVENGVTRETVVVEENGTTAISESIISEAAEEAASTIKELCEDGEKHTIDVYIKNDTTKTITEFYMTDDASGEESGGELGTPLEPGEELEGTLTLNKDMLNWTFTAVFDDGTYNYTDEASDFSDYNPDGIYVTLQEDEDGTISWVTGSYAVTE